MRHFYIRLGAYDISVIVIITLGVLLGTVAAATYMWATKTVDVSVEEPLNITNFPSAIRTHPGQNQTLDITIENVASVSYTVTLIFTLNDTAYQTQYVTFSNNVYAISPGTNQIIAWMATDKQGSPTNLQLTIQFYRE
jgi:hypothetical protein